MSITMLPPDLFEVLTKISKQSEIDRHTVAQLLFTLNKTLLSPLLLIMDKAQALQQANLTPDEHQKYASQIQQAGTEILAQINNLISFPQMAMEAAASTAPPNPETSIRSLCEELKGIRTLIIDDDADRASSLFNQLEAIGLQCSATSIDEALTILNTAEQEKIPYQVVVISSLYFDHQIAYLARTIKASTLLNHVMLTLALPTKLMDFEKERAYFGGFACVLNLSQPARLPSKLLSSWRSWSAKINFSHTANPVEQNLILLVEDDPIPQKVTQRQLTELGFKVDTAADGESALQLLSQKHYSLVFMDIGLPDISGLEVTSEFRKRENGSSHTPIIGLTIYTLESDEETGLQAGMDEYLVKPLLPDNLKAVLKRWLNYDGSPSAHQKVG